MAAPDIPADRAEGEAPAPKRPLIMRYAARSDVGRVRAKNDDSAYVGPAPRRRRRRHGRSRRR